MRREQCTITGIEKKTNGPTIPSIESLINRICEENPSKDPRRTVILISATLPGSGSTTVAREIAEFLRQKYGEPEMRLVGGEVRESLQSGDDASLNNNSDKVPDHLNFYHSFYQHLPENRPLIVENELAVATGPNFLMKNGEDVTRPIIGITLHSLPMVSAIRIIINREGKTLTDIISNPNHILSIALNLDKRTEYITKLLDIVMKSFKQRRLPDAVINIDTTRFNVQEIIGFLTGNINWLTNAPDWEVDALRRIISNLEDISLTRGLFPNLKDTPHFRENIDGVIYNLTQRLLVTINPRGLSDIRENIRKMLLHTVFALLLKRAPRFLRRQNNTLEIDTISQKWTPEYYKLMVAWQTIKAYLGNKFVLDPFAGAGTFINVLTARGIVRGAVLGDISYVGGRPLNGEDVFYEPDFNTYMIHALFNILPSWYKPDCLERTKGYVTLDAIRLPFTDESFDWVIGDPPYGINLNDGGLDLLFEIIPEVLRVSRNGGFFLVPIQWVKKIREKGIEVEQLTDDLSNNNSDVPTCFIIIPKK